MTYAAARAQYGRSARRAPRRGGEEVARQPRDVALHGAHRCRQRDVAGDLDVVSEPEAG